MAATRTLNPPGTIGLRTPLPAQSMDLVLITSRLAGLRDRWGERLLEEAYRIGREWRNRRRLPG